MKEKSNEHHLPKVVGIHEHLLKKDVKNWNDGDNELLIYVFSRYVITKMSTLIRHKFHSKKRIVRMNIAVPILATVLYV